MDSLQCSVFKKKSVIKCHQFPWAKMQELSPLADLKNLFLFTYINHWAIVTYHMPSQKICYQSCLVGTKAQSVQRPNPNLTPLELALASSDLG